MSKDTLTGTYVGTIGTMVRHTFGFIDLRGIARIDNGPMEIQLKRDLMFHHLRCPHFEVLKPSMTVSFTIARRPEHSGNKGWEGIDVQPYVKKK
ncbi:hypothetical protein A2853_02165 [Candidatus Kaiserbacteria bacterium RIFCSPHIGHO2_01_FULL_55_17]|uniref:Uncharacterized protein n=1 Tax=Candidatus Kaiserbacteria bacterium RIFCSPHIGHO2_01_FULL_55_17 TaxID=1798484 RepID=A0A1F6D8G6_9BACT|nr:MAG: hypothetical protein A2853_02165 [Candidatus Kaiserbacteria bacterium RIFCSPHIGHO2_01_FULL_55_17]